MLWGHSFVLDFTSFDTLQVLHSICKVHLPDSSGFHLAWSISYLFQLSTYLSLTCTNFSFPHISTFTCSLFPLASISTYLTPTHFSIHIREPLPNSTPAHLVHLPRLLLSLGSSEHRDLQSTSEFYHGPKTDLKTHHSTSPGDPYHCSDPCAATGIDHGRNGEMESSSPM